MAEALRLSKYEVSAIKSAANATFPAGTCVFLFGSRTVDSGRGGDIDLFVDGMNIPISQWVKQRATFVVRIWQQLGEQRIDVILGTGKEKEVSDIVLQAKKTGVFLFEVKS